MQKLTVTQLYALKNSIDQGNGYGLRIRAEIYFESEPYRISSHVVAWARDKYKNIYHLVVCAMESDSGESDVEYTGSKILNEMEKI